MDRNAVDSPLYLEEGLESQRSVDYSLPKDLLVRLALSALTGRQRSFEQDSLVLLRRLNPPLRVLGKENIPQNGPGVLTMNHYWKPGFMAIWSAVSISSVVPAKVYWTMSNAWTYPGRPFGQLYRYGSHKMLMAIANVYGFNTMPPMPPNPVESQERALAVQRLIRYSRQHPNALIGLAPEGSDQPGGVLSLPPSGSGRLAMEFSRRGIPFYPVGSFDDGVFTLVFGKPYYLEMPGIHDRHELDLLARQKMMREIAKCLPESLRGPFSD